MFCNFFIIFFVNKLSETELFELFFDDELIALMVEQSTLYCLSKNWPHLKVYKRRD